MSELVERLRGYNPPDRTVDDQRQIAVDIHEAAARIEALEAALRGIDNMAPATCEVTLAHQMADIARAALEPEK